MVFNSHRWRAYGIACNHHHHLTVTHGIISPQLQLVLKIIIILLTFSMFLNSKSRSTSIVWPPKDIFTFVNTVKLVTVAFQQWPVTCSGLNDGSGCVLRQTVKILLQRHQFRIVKLFFVHLTLQVMHHACTSRQKLVERHAKLAQAVSCRDTAKSDIDYLGASLTWGVGRTPEQRR